MAKLSSRVLWGSILIIAGLLFLMESLGLMVVGTIWPIVFGIAGILFVYSFIRDPQQWWPVIPGFTLLGLASVIFLDAVAPMLSSQLTGSVFLAWIGLSFLTILISTRGRQWWAVIPGGILLTLAVVTAFEPFVTDVVGGALFMFGVAATFVAVYLIPTTTGHKMRWALYPAAVVGIIGILLLTAAVQLAQMVWPVALIAIGLYVILKNLRGQGSSE